MGFSAFMPLFSLPALVLALAGLWGVGLASRDSRKEGFLWFLLTAAPLMTLPMALFAERLYAGDVVYVLLLEIPAVIGTLSLLLIRWRGVQDLWSRQPFTVTSLLAVLALLLMVIAIQAHPLAIILIVPALILAGIWVVGVRLGEGGLTGGGLLLALLAGLDSLGLIGNPLVYATPWLRAAYRIGSVIALVLALVLVARLVDRGLAAREEGDRRRAATCFLVGAFLLLALVGTIFRHGVLIIATGHAAEDHMPVGAVALAVVAGLLLSFGAGERRPRAGLAVLVLLPLLFTGAYWAGLQLDPLAITAARADRLERALDEYRQDNGLYPADLGRLTPAYMPLVLGPLTGRGQVWCYQGGGDAYRLGYGVFQRYYGRGWSDPLLEVRLHSAAGESLDGPWNCEEMERLLSETHGL